MSLEHQVLSGLIFNEEFARRTLPFISADYFRDEGQKVVFNIIHEYMSKYSHRPSIDAVTIDLTNTHGLNQKVYEQAGEIVLSLAQSDVDTEWLVDQTEEWCKDRALVLGLVKSMAIIDDDKQKISRGSIPKILQDALGVSFDTKIGHDFLDDSEKRFEYYHAHEERVPFDLAMMNKITQGGTPNKTLNMLIGPTGSGKTLFMCHFAAANLFAGKNVLYVTMEMAEERIAQRIDANLLDVEVNSLKDLTRDVYTKKMEKLKARTVGKLVIREYPTGTAGAAHFRHLLNELKLKKKFIPDVIYIDYLNICCSTRLRASAAENSYLMMKAIAEELRGLAVEFGIPLWTATQTNRGGADNSDFSMTDVAESFGMPMTADFMIGIIRTPELDALNQVLMKQMKNRYNGIQLYSKFILGLDNPKFRLFDVEASAQHGMDDSGEQDNVSARGRPSSLNTGKGSATLSKTNFDMG